MEIIMLQDFPQLGFIGEQHNVKKRYARNFLIPRGIAIESSSRNARQMQHKMAAINALKAKKKEEAQALLEKIAQAHIEFKLKVGESGKTFGSIGTRDIEGALRRAGFEINRKQLSLGEPIKSVGEFQVTLRLHSEVQTKLKVQVIAEKVVEAKPAEEGEDKKPRGRRGRGAKAEAEAPAEESAAAQNEAQDAEE